MHAQNKRELSVLATSPTSATSQVYTLRKAWDKSLPLPSFKKLEWDSSCF